MDYTEALLKNLMAAALLAALLYVSYRPTRRVQAQAETAQPDPGTRTLLIRCGLHDKSAKSWEGSIVGEPPGAQVISLAGYHFQPPDNISDSRFSFATRPWIPPAPQTDLSPGLPGRRPIFPNGIYAVVKGISDANKKRPSSLVK